MDILELGVILVQGVQGTFVYRGITEAGQQPVGRVRYISLWWTTLDSTSNFLPDPRLRLRTVNVISCCLRARRAKLSPSVRVLVCMPGSGGGGDVAAGQCLPGYPAMSTGCPVQTTVSYKKWDNGTIRRLPCIYTTVLHRQIWVPY